jgi:two-component system sensor histidine kinase DctS
MKPTRWPRRLLDGLGQQRKSRGLLWTLLVLLVGGLLALLVWLAGRYENTAAQERMETYASDLAAQMRNGLTRNLRSLQALPAERAAWQLQAHELLQLRREMVRIEWRDTELDVRLSSDSPYRQPAFGLFKRDLSQADVGLACSAAQRFKAPAYSTSYFVPQADGIGLELMDLCLPVSLAGQPAGFTVATYVLNDLLSEVLGEQLTRGHAASFTEADGTRLALYGSAGQGSKLYAAQQLVDLPGNTLVLRLESRQSTAAFFPNVLTALVTTMTLALCAVLALLVRDMRRRLKVERDLAEALAFRKAMENSLKTGLRARDLEGRITYVNPAFCQMVGVQAEDLLNHSATPAPYWPPELANVYLDRQTFRQTNNALPRGGHESVFMRSDGTRFPVLIIEAPLINAAGKHTGWMSAILDLSEQKRAEELSRASQDRLQATARLAMVGEMASLLSHELNQPLAAISSYANGCLNLLRTAQEAGQAPTAEQRRLTDDLEMALRRTAEQAGRAGRVIKSVRDFVRRREHRREAVKPADLMDAVMPLVDLQARKLGVQVMISAEPGCPDVWCDRAMVEQVLLNLARNGMQAMQRPLAGLERVLSLRVGHHQTVPRWVVFSVADMGEGVAGEAAERLFTPFFTTKEEGMGLGLSLCRTVVEQHGGVLSFEANEPRGTIFTFTLPAAFPDELPPAPHAGRQSARTAPVLQ